MQAASKFLVVAAFASVLVAIGLFYHASTSDDRVRQRATSELEQLGAYFVGFEEDTVIPDSAYFVSVRSLSGIERFSTLRHLDFTDSDISDYDLRHLVLLPQVFSIELDGTTITDQGIDTLSQIRNLNVLDLTGTKITDASVPSLARIAGLQGVIVNETQLSQSGVQQLMKLRPDIWIEHESVLDLDEQDAATNPMVKPLGDAEIFDVDVLRLTRE